MCTSNNYLLYKRVCILLSVCVQISCSFKYKHGIIYVSFRVFYVQLRFNKRQSWCSSLGRSSGGEGDAGSPDLLRASLHSLYMEEFRCRAPEAVRFSYKCWKQEHKNIWQNSAVWLSLCSINGCYSWWWETFLWLKIDGIPCAIQTRSWRWRMKNLSPSWRL